jgi:hypothetical protein
VVDRACVRHAYVTRWNVLSADAVLGRDLPALTRHITVLLRSANADPLLCAHAFGMPGGCDEEGCDPDDRRVLHSNNYADEGIDIAFATGNILHAMAMRGYTLPPAMHQLIADSTHVLLC